MTSLTHVALEDEADTVARLLTDVGELPEAERAVAAAAVWVEGVRRLADQQSPLDALLQEYDLSTQEGVLLMCIAEALLRIPDEETAEKLIADKLGGADWDAHMGRSESVFVNASTWGLMLTGKIIRGDAQRRDWRGALKSLVSRSGEPMVRLALRAAMKMMGGQFVMGRTIEAAMQRARKVPQDRYSFDMLGEAALTADAADRYLKAYAGAVRAVGAHAGAGGMPERNSISVKLSALHPRYHPSQWQRILREMPPRLLQLAKLAREQGIGLTVDAEEADRLELSLQVFEAVYKDPALADWDGLGLAIQAYQKRAPDVIRRVAQLARDGGRRIPVRLVKGAYWDSEIKWAHEQGLAGFPVFTRKASTDVSYIACARMLLAARDAIAPQFATHNAHTIATILLLNGEAPLPEFQRLHGMGAALYDTVRKDYPQLPVRVYAPVGSHEDLLPYLVRRLLENGANTSFVNRIFDEAVPATDLVGNPVAEVKALETVANPNIPAPYDLFSDRDNSAGEWFGDPQRIAELEYAVRPRAQSALVVTPLVAGAAGAGRSLPIEDPADTGRVLGQWATTGPEQIEQAVAAAEKAQPFWQQRGVDARAAALNHAADNMHARREELYYWLVREAGKTLPDAIAEVREAIDFCRYYALRAVEEQQRIVLPGPAGEDNSLERVGRGVFVCISPWNFPLAIFMGQVTAALVTGNAVLAKPAEQTNAIAWLAVKILHAAGVPPEVLQLLPGNGETVGHALVSHPATAVEPVNTTPAVAGVVFTGSTAVARHINRTLAQREGPIVPLIAETGGVNAMVVDSSALLEQVTRDVLQSAFGSAGQRCSALRVLFLQEDIADEALAMLSGALDELVVGDPGLYATDVGPVIDDEAWQRLKDHVDGLAAAGARLVAQAHGEKGQGRFFLPSIHELPRDAELPGEAFGPVLHVVRFAASGLAAVVDKINSTGYGLTVGVHSRIESTWRVIQQGVKAGNCYVNRSMTGAVVGVQPFGGEGLSGTGPKAGGPYYLTRFLTERTVTVNTAAIGGNATLLAAPVEPGSS